MAKLVILGSSNAIPDLERENTHLALVADSGTVLIDCSGTPTVRLSQAGIALDDITDLILTHFHPDHVSGVPLLLMNMWLLGRAKPLTIHALKHCLDRIERLMEDYLWKTWPGFFDVELKAVPDKEGSEVISGGGYRILASPVEHLVPTIGLRFESTEQDRAIAYSCDTAPSVSVQRLARDAEVLIHEAAGASPGHSTARQAGEIARKAGAGRLLLIHFPRLDAQGESELRMEAQASFGGQVGLAEDMMTLDL